MAISPLPVKDFSLPSSKIRVRTVLEILFLPVSSDTSEVWRKRVAMAKSADWHDGCLIENAQIARLSHRTGLLLFVKLF